MDIEKYRQIIQQLILEKQARKSYPEGIEKQAVLDTERDHYLLLHTGWCNNRRTHGCSLHIDIKDGKIWIQHDGTEAGIATQLLELGVPKDNIVLAFHSPYMREFTEFATQ
ncbi:XisI protein [Plectonema cf. radiosum LEGE 06105]|uniref:XisI protein n=1 Tax=Plectonema cf. radiosum LEGE 06105 TaxID=945769 RepID=A0A8J7FFU1_9CYAN|nr:XisI protein [Plectonema radiosum]MBE9215678.1 XisI protein [Plectonema cf. radiosum LEGE 06105]